MPRRIAGAYVFNFWRTCRTVHAPAALYMPSSRAHGFQVLHVLVNISYFLFVDSSHCNECEVGFHSANLLLSQSESLRNYLFTDRSEPVCWMLGHSVPSSPKGQLLNDSFYWIGSHKLCQVSLIILTRLLHKNLIFISYF